MHFRVWLSAELLFNWLHCCAIYVAFNVVEHLKYNKLTCESYNYCPVGANNVLWKVASAVAGRKPLRAVAARSWKRTGYTVVNFMYMLNIVNH